jgi:hypothetical protein
MTKMGSVDEESVLSRLGVAVSSSLAMLIAGVKRGNTVFLNTIKLSCTSPK